MVEFLFGALAGFSVGYPLGLWAIGYTEKRNHDRG